MGGALHFDYLWGESSLEERLLLSTMARTIGREGGVATLGEITGILERFDLEVGPTTVQAAARTLVGRQLLATDVDLRQYEFKFDLLRLWLDRYQRFGVVAEEYRRQLRHPSPSPHQPTAGDPS